MGERTLSRKVFPANSIVFQEGEMANCAYLLKSGQVEITTVRDGQMVHLTSVTPNQLFGEMALLDGSARSATATCLVQSEVVIVNDHDIKQQLEKLEPFMRYWIDYLTDRVRDLTKRAYNPEIEDAKNEKQSKDEWIVD